MKKTVISLALLAASTVVLANNTGHHGPKTPPTKPDTSGPKTPPSPAPAARSTPTRDEGQRDTSTALCSRWPTMLFCDRP